MKKLSLLIALCMLLSIGGVYATWTYTEASTDSVDQTLSHGLATAQQSGNAGTITIENNNIAILIDQKDTAYNAELKITGVVELKFVLNSGAPSDTVNSLNARIALRNTDRDAAKYRDIHGAMVPVYKTVNEGFIDVVWGQDSQNPSVFTATISAEQIAAVLLLGSDFKAPTYVAWSALHEAEQEIGIDLFIEAVSAPAVAE